MKKFFEFLKKHKKLIIIIAVVAVVAIIVVKIVSAVNNAKNLLAGMQSSASTEKIEQRDIVNSVTATGTIVAVENRTFSTSVTGIKIKNVNVEVGDEIKAGDILCVLDEEDLEKQLADAQTTLNADAGRSGIDVAASNRGLNEAIVNRDIAAKRAEEDKSSAYNNFSSAADECQEAKDAYDEASKKVDDAKSAMNSAKEALDRANSMGVAAMEQADQDKALTGYNDELTRFKDYISTRRAELAASSEAEKKAEATKLISDSDLSTLLDTAWDTDKKVYSSKISSVSASQIYNGDDADITSRVNTSISALSSGWTSYQSALSASANQRDMTIAGAEAAYQTAKANYEAAKATEESKKSLYDSKVKNVESLYDQFNQTVRNADDSARNNESTVASRVDSVKNSKLSASTATLADKRNIDKIEEQLDGCIVSSSIGGIVTAVNVKEGDTYAGGAMVTIEDTSSYEVAAQIDEYDIAKIKVGQEVVIKTNGTGTLELEGKVKSIAPHATQNAAGTSGVKYEVRISVLTKNEDLKLDMTAKIEIICEKSENVLSVPKEAIQEDDDGNFFVEILDSGEPVDTSSMLTDPESVSKEDLEKVQNGEKTYQSHNVFVTKGLEGDYYCEISGEGLEADMRVVVPNNGAFSDISEYMDEAGAMGGF
ncbi:MAG: efflux RND transporter periplasmic adaptor subunit [Lachnospiraceae bacterium]|nr:efflux RND transporter periplasmic adaptor subunit [Lachnospiraceae bacterium]